MEAASPFSTDDALAQAGGQLAPSTSRGCSTSLSPDSASCARFARRIQRLYSLPAVALRVVRLTTAREADVRALTECLESDPALCARVLAVVNSSVFGLREKVWDLNQAVTLLGIKPLKLLVLGLSLPKDLVRVQDADVLRNYWRHALVKSVAAREISRRFFQRRFEDEAFIAGLLQDLGQLALVQQLASPYVRLLELVQQHRADLVAAERAALGFDHVALSGELLLHWGLPSALVQYVRISPQSIRATGAAAAQVVSLILWMAELCARILSGRPEALLALQAAGREQGLQEDQLGLLLYELESKVKPLAEALSIETRDWPEFRGIIDLAYAALAQAAEELLEAQEQGRAVAIDARTLQALADESRRFAAGGSASGEGAGRSASPPSSSVATVESEVPAAKLPAIARAAPLGDAITAAVGWCRAQRRPLSLLLIEWSGIDGPASAAGPTPAASAAAILRPFLAELIDERCSVLPLTEASVAMVIRDCARPQALELARRLLDLAGLGVPRHTISIGVASLAMALRNFASEDLESAARRCLFAARQSGGGMVKSIDVI